MDTATKVLIGVIALLHLYIAWFEMFAWEARGPKVFKSFPKELFSQTKAMAGNQGIYNSFLAAGLIWTFFIDDITWARNVGLFFLACIGVAGIYGFLTVEKRILFVQTVPATIAIILLIL